MATPIAVLAVVHLVLHPIGHLEVLAVGLVSTEVMAMIMILAVVMAVVVLVVVLVLAVVSLVIKESQLMAILVALVPMQEGLVGDMVPMA